MPQSQETPSGATPDSKTPRPPRLRDRLRLLPVLMVAAGLMFGVKIGDIWQGADTLLTGIPSALAEDRAPAASSSAPVGEAAANETAGGASSGAADDGQAFQAERGDDDDAPYSRGELQLLESLAERRALLDKREKELEMRERVLAAMEKRIDDKIAKVKKIESTVSEFLEEYDDQHKKKLESLVKVYEKMKPDDAARILERLDMDILISVAGKIRENRMASILAEMDPAAAKALTVELATKDAIPVPTN